MTKLGGQQAVKLTYEREGISQLIYLTTILGIELSGYYSYLHLFKTLANSFPTLYFHVGRL